MQMRIAVIRVLPELLCADDMAEKSSFAFWEEVRDFSFYASTAYYIQV